MDLEETLHICLHLLKKGHIFAPHSCRDTTTEDDSNHLRFEARKQLQRCAPYMYRLTLMAGELPCLLGDLHLISLLQQYLQEVTISFMRRKENIQQANLFLLLLIKRGKLHGLTLKYAMLAIEEDLADSVKFCFQESVNVAQEVCDKCKTLRYPQPTLLLHNPYIDESKWPKTAQESINASQSNKIIIPEESVKPNTFSYTFKTGKQTQKENKSTVKHSKDHESTNFGRLPRSQDVIVGEVDLFDSAVATMDNIPQRQASQSNIASKSSLTDEEYVNHAEVNSDGQDDIYEGIDTDEDITSEGRASQYKTELNGIVENERASRCLKKLVIIDSDVGDMFPNVLQAANLIEELPVCTLTNLVTKQQAGGNMGSLCKLAIIGTSKPFNLSHTILCRICLASLQTVTTTGL